MPSERHESPVTQATTVGYGHRQSCLWSNETRCSLRKRSSVSLLGRARQEPGGRLQHRTRPPNRHPEHGPPLRPRKAPATKVGITVRLRERHKVYCPADIPSRTLVSAVQARARQARGERYRQRARVPKDVLSQIKPLVAVPLRQFLFHSQVTA